MRLLKPSQWSIRLRFTFLFLIAGLGPLSIAGISAYRSARDSLNQTANTCASSLTERVSSQLESIRDGRRDQIQSFFDFIFRQVRVLSHDNGVHDAVKQLRPAFAQYRSEANISDPQIVEMRSELANYYQSTFGAEYRKQNGVSSDSTRIVEALSPDTVAMQHAYIVKNANPLGSKHRLDSADDLTTYGKLHRKFHPSLRELIEQFGYYDCFLVDANTGSIVYTTFKETDFATNLNDGPYAQTSIGKCFRMAKSASEDEPVVIADFEKYRPSYDLPAGFIGAPIREGSELLGVLIFQISPDWIDQIMRSRTGLGETGDAYLVGADHLMRSNSHQDREHHGFAESFRNPSTGRIDSAAITGALNGESGVAEFENGGMRRLTAWSPVRLGDKTWALVVDLADTEAKAAVVAALESANTQRDELRGKLWFVAALGALLVIVMALIVAAQMARPLVNLSSNLDRVAANDLTVSVEVSTGGEIGQLAHACRTMIDGLTRTVAAVRQSASDTMRVSSEVRASSQKLSEDAQGQAAALAEASASVEQISTAARNNSENAQEADRLASSARDVAVRGGDVLAESQRSMNEIRDASKKIAEIIGTIDEIAFQTNLLALNAAVEAARAGEQGRGFAVVAAEVGSLAGRSSSAAREIKQLIGDALSKVETGVSSMQRSSETLDEIVGAVKRVADIVTQISGATREQSLGLSEINQVVTKMDEVTQSNTAQADELQGLSANLEQRAGELMEIVRAFKIQEARSASLARMPSAGTLPLVPGTLMAATREFGTAPSRAESRYGAGSKPHH